MITVQQIVEIVRDAAGELADRLHLLRLAQRLLGASRARAISAGDALLQRLVERLQLRPLAVPVSRWRAWNSRALSIAIAACAAMPATMRSARSLKTPGSAWPKNSPPSTSPEREITGTAR